MPRYYYKCLSCETVYEINHKITEDPEILCPKDSFICKRQIAKNVMFETPMDAEWIDDPRTLDPKSIAQAQRASKQKYRW